MKALLGIMIATQLLSSPSMIGAVVYEENVTMTEEVRGEEEPTRAEEFMWFYRIHNGVQQKRLWSITYEYWATDWIDC